MSKKYGVSGISHIKKALSFFICIYVVQFSFAQGRDYFKAGDYVQALKQVTDVMVNDVASPVAASRYYAYITIAANEVCAKFYPGARSFAGSLHQFDKINISERLITNANASTAIMLAVYKMSGKLLPSGYMLKKPADSILAVAEKKGLLKTESTILLADTIVDQILQYSKSDGFNKLSGFKRYTPLQGDAFWQPTAPGFMQPLEPFWNTLRTFVIDSSQQFKPRPPAVYDTSKASVYYQLLQEVYEKGKHSSGEQKNIALFWDCNPFSLEQIGHLEFGLKKISPGGHWMGITGIACLQTKKSLLQTACIHAWVAITLADAFISCWDEKYRSNRIRPETAIKRLIDPSWQPLLQTPPFPEYTSGHSVISTASAVVLTNIFGDGFTFTDDTEIIFGLKPRKFTSFLGAAAEAAISRLYGGIHYRDAIENGIEQGKQIGDVIIRKLLNDKWAVSMGSL